MGEETAEVFARTLNGLVNRLREGAQSIKQQRVDPHPLLAEKDVSLKVKMAYVEGCVMSTCAEGTRLSSDDIRRIGLSLGLTEHQVNDCLTVVTRFSKLGNEQQNTYLDEMKNALSDSVVAKYYLADVKGE